MNHEATRCGRLLGAAAVALLAGCIVIPVDYHASGSRHNVSAEIQPKLQLGVTTKEEVFLLLGEPDRVSEDGQRLGYGWSKVKAVVMWGAQYSGGISEVEKSYLLHITFDADNRIAHVGLVEKWGGSPAPPQ